MAIATEELREAVVFLGAAGLVVPAIHRLNVSPALGFLAVGLVISPFGLGRLAPIAPWLDYLVIRDNESVALAAEFGVVFLLFMIGLELSFERLRAMWRIVFGLGGAQVLITAAVISAVAVQLGNRADVSVVLGSSLALSSTAIVMHLLTEEGRLGTAVGQASFGILLFQDLAVVPILFMVGAANPNAAPVPFEMPLAVGKSILAIFLILGLGRLVARPMFRLVARTGSRELFLAAVLLVVIGAAEATEAAELSAALGAFLAGLLLADTEYRHRIAIDVEPFKGLLLGVFFVSVGLRIDLAEIIAEPAQILLAAVGLISLKAFIVYALVRLSGLNASVALETALLLGPVGEFAFVVIDLSLSLGVIYDEPAQFILIVVGLTMAIAPLLAALAERLATRIGARSLATDKALGVAGQLSQHIVVVGYGRVGRAIGELLASQSIPFVAIDLDSDRVAALRGQGAAIYHGDARQHEILARLGVRDATALVVTMDDPKTALQTVAAARNDWPNLPIYARVRDEDHASELLRAGATHVILEAREAALQLGEAVLVCAGLEESAARDLVVERRDATKFIPAA